MKYPEFYPKDASDETKAAIDKIVDRLNGSWHDTLYPDDETAMFKSIPVKIRIFMGFTEVMGYLVACEDYGIIDGATAEVLEAKYTRLMEIELENCNENGQ